MSRWIKPGTGEGSILCVVCNRNRGTVSDGTGAGARFLCSYCYFEKSAKSSKKSPYVEKVLSEIKKGNK